MMVCKNAGTPASSGSPLSTPSMLQSLRRAGRRLDIFSDFGDFVYCGLFGCTKKSEIVPVPGGTKSRQAATGRGCSCGSGSVSLYTNEIFRPSSTGDVCVGGCVEDYTSQQRRGAPLIEWNPNGPASFELHKEGSIVSKITVWFGNPTLGYNTDIIVGLRLNFAEDDEDYVVGRTDGSKSQECLFSPGQTLAGDVVMAANVYGTALQYFKITKSGDDDTGKTCEFGDPKKLGKYVYRFPSHESYLAGVTGLTGPKEGNGVDSELVHLGLIFWKSIAHGPILRNIVYPDLDSQTKVKAPVSLAQHRYCNDDDVVRAFESFSEKVEVSHQTESCWTVGGSIKFGNKVSVEAQIPELVKASEEFHWEVTISGDYKSCTKDTTTTTQTLSFPYVRVEANTATTWSFTQYQGRLSALKYVADIQVTFKDGTEWSQVQHGLYSGTSYMSIDSSFIGDKEKVCSCNPLDKCWKKGKNKTADGPGETPNTTATPRISPDEVPNVPCKEDVFDKIAIRGFTCQELAVDFGCTARMLGFYDDTPLRIWDLHPEEHIDGAKPPAPLSAFCPCTCGGDHTPDENSADDRPNPTPSTTPPPAMTNSSTNIANSTTSNSVSEELAAGNATGDRDNGIFSTVPEYVPWVVGGTVLLFFALAVIATAVRWGKARRAQSQRVRMVSNGSSQGSVYPKLATKTKAMATDAQLADTCNDMYGATGFAQIIVGEDVPAGSRVIKL